MREKRLPRKSDFVLKRLVLPSAWLVGDDIGEESSRFISTLIWFRLGVKTDSEDGRWKKLGNEAFNCCLWITGFSTSLLDTKVAGCDGAHGDEATTGETGNIGLATNVFVSFLLGVKGNSAARLEGEKDWFAPDTVGELNGRWKILGTWELNIDSWGVSSSNSVPGFRVSEWGGLCGDELTTWAMNGKSGPLIFSWGGFFVINLGWGNPKNFFSILLWISVSVTESHKQSCRKQNSNTELTPNFDLKWYHQNHTNLPFLPEYYTANESKHNNSNFKLGLLGISMFASKM